MTATRIKSTAALLLGILLVVTLWLQPFATPAQKAVASWVRLHPLLQSSSRWAHVGGVVSTGGLIELKGSISSVEHAQELMAIVKGSKPSCGVEPSIYVYPQDQLVDDPDHIRGYLRRSGASAMEISKHPYLSYAPVTRQSSSGDQ